MASVITMRDSKTKSCPFFLVLFYSFPIVLGLSDEVNLSVDYFVGVETRFVCLLTCGNDNGIHKLVKQASLHNIAASSAEIDSEKQLNLKNIDACLQQTSLPIGVLINQKCSGFEDVMNYASQNGFFDTTHKWLIHQVPERYKFILNKSDATNPTNNSKNNVDITNSIVVNVLNKLNLSVDADITVSMITDLHKYDLYEMFNFGKMRNGKFIIQRIGSWNDVEGLNITTQFKYYRRWNFEAMALKMIISMTPVPKVFDPEMLMGRIPAPGVAVISQTSAVILKEIAGIHNFRFTFTVVDRWVGDYNRAHIYTATNGIFYREHDITPVLRFLPQHFDRYDVLFPPVTHLETRYFYRIPSHGIGKFENQFLRPLSTATWWCVVAVAVLCGIVLLLSNLVEERPINLAFAGFSVLALICQQFFEEFEDLKRISSARKMTVLVTGLSCLLIYNYYTSSVVSWLLNGPPPSINSLWELLDSPLQPAFQDTGYSYSWLQLPDYYYNKKSVKAEDELKRRLLNMQKNGKNIFKPVDEGIDLVKQGGYVYHTDINGANKRISQTFNQRELCDLDSLKSMEKALLYPCVPKRSSYREFFIWSLSRLLERGVIRCMQIRTWSQGVKCEGSSPRALALGGAAPAFILLAAGHVLGVFIMLGERLKWKLEGSKSRRF